MANSSELSENKTTLSDMIGKGIAIPPSVNTFVNERYSGKLEQLYSYNGNANTLYTVKYDNKYYTGQFSERIDTNDYIIGGTFKSALSDAEFVTKFLETSRGTRFLTRQFLLQGYQPFDETKLYNPLSPILSSAEPGMWGLLDRPTRHIDTTNIIGGVIDASGLGTVRSIAQEAGSIITGDSYETATIPPRSSVASNSSTGYGLSTLTSLLGADRTNEVLSPIARDSAKGLLRGGTATDAFASSRYSRIVRSNDNGSILSRLATQAVSYIAQKTPVGSLANPTQPWDANYRADEKTYDFLIGSSDLFYPSAEEQTPTSITEGIIGSLGFEKAFSFNSNGVRQRFHARLNDINNSFISIVNRKHITTYINYISQKFDSILPFENKEYSEVSSVQYNEGDDIRYTTNINPNSDLDVDPKLSLKYTDLISRNSDIGEISDVLYEYKKYVNANSSLDQGKILRSNGYNKNDTSNHREFLNQAGINTNNDIDVLKSNKDFYSNDPEKYNVEETTSSLENIYNKTLDDSNFDKKIPGLFSNEENEKTLDLESNFNTITNKILKNDTYQIKLPRSLYPLEFQKFGTENVGQAYLTKNNVFKKYDSQLEQSEFPTVDFNVNGNGRTIGNHNTANYVNTLDPIKDTDFESNYTKINESYGPDLIKFYFYDIVNKVYIPFNAIIANLAESNNADWQRMDYIGRADKLYHYGGFSRTLNLNFKIVIGSIRELLPTWKRINYLVGLTRPSNYSDTVKGGAIVPPMVQLTLGDFYKNHFIIFNSINIQIPQDASWELVPEEKNIDWSYNIRKSIEISEKYKGSIKYAQFPLEADISCNLSILEKDRPMVGHAIWGDAPMRFGTITESENYEQYNTWSDLGQYRVSMLTGEVTSIQSTQTSSLHETYTLTAHYEDQEYFKPYENREFSNNLITFVNENKITKLSKDYHGEYYIQTFNADYGNLENTEVYERNNHGEIIYDSNGNMTEINNITLGRDANNNFEDVNEERRQFDDQIRNEPWTVTK